MKNVVVLGASANPERYSHLAMLRLREHGHHAIPVNPAMRELLGEPCHPSLRDLPGPVDTITVYLAPDRSTPLIPEILAAAPRRLILNPGAENPALAEAARKAGIEVLDACTLVMLATGAF